VKFIIYSSESISDPHIVRIEEEYLKRMSAWVPIILKNKGSFKGRAKGGMDLMTNSITGSYKIFLDEGGKQLSSDQFAQLLNRSMQNSGKDTTFFIGPSEGWLQSDLKEADMILSLSTLTFPHKLVRLLLVEQIYRGLTILRNHPYHKT
jgi:23S rRNA (pseudouridine1915-N3)-methyltransferase